MWLRYLHRSIVPGAALVGFVYLGARSHVLEKFMDHRTRDDLSILHGLLELDLEEQNFRRSIAEAKREKDRRERDDESWR